MEFRSLETFLPALVNQVDCTCTQMLDVSGLPNINGILATPENYGRTEHNNTK